jgi:hypothetical protein
MEGVSKSSGPSGLNNVIGVLDKVGILARWINITVLFCYSP